MHRQAVTWNWKSITPYSDTPLWKARQITTDRLTTKRGIAAAGSAAPDHQHPYDQWFHLLNGEATMICDKVPYELRKGSVMLIPAGTTHSLVCRTECEILEIGLGVDGQG